MKLRLFLLLLVACTLLAGNAMAQGCSTAPIAFPASGFKSVPTGTCLANVDAGVTGQGGRLRWDGSPSSAGELLLFDADDAGLPRLWCANVEGVCVAGNVLCLQSDGNMVIYSGVSVCDGTGTAVWNSHTQNANDGGEELTVDEDVTWKNMLRTGDRAVVRNNSGPQWVSIGYND